MDDISLGSLKSLTIFRTLFETGSATKTAKVLGITQSGVSRSLAVLEENLGLSLFIRDKNRLIKSPEAQELYGEVLGLLNNLDELKHSVVALREFGASRLRIATIPGLGFGYVPRIIARILELNTKLNIYCDIMSTPDVLRHVESGQFNMGFVTLPVTGSRLQIDTIARTEAVCVLPREHPLTSKKIVSIWDLNGQHLIIPNKPNLAADQLLKLIDQHGLSITAKTETNIAGLCALVGNAVGIGVINPITARDQSNDRFVTRPFAPQIDYSFGFVYAKNWRGNKMINLMHKCITEVGRHFNIKQTEHILGQNQ